jgi:hypothetical protein
MVAVEIVRCLVLLHCSQWFATLGAPGILGNPRSLGVMEMDLASPFVGKMQLCKPALWPGH